MRCVPASCPVMRRDPFFHAAALAEPCGSHHVKGELGSPTTAAGLGPPDLLERKGRIFTGAPDLGEVGAPATPGGRVAAVAGVADLVGSETSQQRPRSSNKGLPNCVCRPPIRIEVRDALPMASGLLGALKSNRTCENCLDKGW
jgi:hypothetical protein